MSYLKQTKLLNDKILRGTRKTGRTGRNWLMTKKKEIRKKRQQGSLKTWTTKMTNLQVRMELNLKREESKCAERLQREMIRWMQMMKVRKLSARKGKTKTVLHRVQGRLPLSAWASVISNVA